MKGLKQYIKKYGKHFTTDLVADVQPFKWDYSDIERCIRDEVWYNCWSATKGDMLYLVNVVYEHTRRSKRFCIMFMLKVVGNYDERERWFDAFVLDNEDLDLRVYI